MATLRKTINQTTGLPNGVTNAQRESTLSSFIALDPTRAHVVFDDFDNPSDLVAATPVTWTITKGGSSTITQATGTTYGTGGRVLITTGATSGNSLEAQAISDGFVFDPTNRFHMKFLLRCDQVNTSNIILGLQVINTTPGSATDGIYFSKPTGATAVVAKISKSSTTTTSPTITNMVASTDVILGLDYSPTDANDSGTYGAFTFYVNDLKVGGANLAVDTANAPTTTLAPVIFVQTQSNAAIHCAIDYIFIAQSKSPLVYE